ncbi:hypothetical protein K8Z61_08585 [Nocardioides sp. TRM66260-LWL]|uniref:hypothetical protein n=1 Tax=Nocardioides sp. TRM66260-LWL TaxID=2874478 RepID=UPI001CC66C75|nr:hypothetical protein [Nocardioides sp. TRM66260-LWL]MBZ5734554.1 hypothetical protein [Nocardioides sp. TRM66260-LWL]
MSGRVPASVRLTADAIDAGVLGGAGAATAALLHAGAAGACAAAALALLLGRAVLAPRGLAPGAAATRWRWVDRQGSPARAPAVLVVTLVDLVVLVCSLGLLLPASALARGADPAGRGWGGGRRASGPGGARPGRRSTPRRRTARVLRST